MAETLELPTFDYTKFDSDLADAEAIATGETVEVFHEYAGTFRPTAITKVRTLPPSKQPTTVTFRSHIVGIANQRAESPEYLATIRRRKAKKLAQDIKGLSEYSDRDDLTVWTFPIIEQIKDLLATLTDASKEGNTREILRQIRNTFMRGGWNRYRESAVRETVANIFRRLANIEDVEPQHVDDTFEKLSDLGLDTVGSLLVGAEEDSESFHDEEEVEIPD